MKKILMFLMVALTSLSFAKGLLQANGSKTQVIEKANVPQKVEIDVVDYSTKGVKLVDGKIVFEKAGEYLVVAAPQVGAKLEDTSNFRCFLKMNGKNVENSSVLLNVDKDIKDVIITQGVIKADKGDVVEVYMASDSSNNVMIEAIDIHGEPLVPSIILTVY